MRVSNRSPTKSDLSIAIVENIGSRAIKFFSSKIVQISEINIFFEVRAKTKECHLSSNKPLCVNFRYQ